MLLSFFRRKTSTPMNRRVLLCICQLMMMICYNLKINNKTVSAFFKNKFGQVFLKMHKYLFMCYKVCLSATFSLIPCKLVFHFILHHSAIFQKVNPNKITLASFPAFLSYVNELEVCVYSLFLFCFTLLTFTRQLGTFPFYKFKTHYNLKNIFQF